ncbi:nitroreductase/quinone reductase family protein [Nonomuraea sp. LPB2021202275-12-8]|uniref:nitroreductase/quinone reductase family protein n=1 Tax=Nonomuraea sp. LPB2021202275-12-8 TaxID=3120159 RepID=UPI00300DA40A
MEITDSPVAWVADHIRSYVASDGESGHRYQGKDALLLTTRGRRTGTLRRTALFYGADGDRLVVVGSNGGSAHHPAWVLNVRADPEVAVQVGAERFAARARVTEGDERERLWALMLEIFPSYGGMQKKTSRELPVMVIERAEAAG